MRHLCAKMRLSARDEKVLHAAMGANGAVIVNSGDGVQASFQQVTCELSEILLTSEYGTRIWWAAAASRARR